MRDGLKTPLLGVWTVYRRPRDYPAGFVVRMHQVYADGTHAPTSLAYFGPDLASVRAQLPRGLHNVGRRPEDEAQIVESWL